MSLASAQNSFLNANGSGGSGPTPPNLALESLTVAGVPITGLLGQGTIQTATSGSTVVAKVGGGSTLGVSELIINTNDATGIVQFSDIVLAEEDGSWTYFAPLPFEFPLYVSVYPFYGSVPPVVGRITPSEIDPLTSVVSATEIIGSARFSNYTDTTVVGAPRTFGIQGTGKVLVGGNSAGLPTVLSPPAVALNPLAPQSYTSTAVSDFRVTFATSFTTPASINENLIASFKMAWNSTNSWANADGLTFVPYTIFAYLTTTASTTVGSGTLLGSWSGIQGEVASTTKYASFASTPHNQYQSFAVRGLQSETIYYIAFDFNVEPAVQTRNVGLDLVSLTYYPTASPTVASAPALMSVMPSLEAVAPAKKAPVKSRRVKVIIG